MLKNIPVFLLVFILNEGISTTASEIDVVADFETTYEHLTNFYKNREWPQKTAPFKISSKFSKIEQGVIKEAIKTINIRTCDILKNRTNERDYLKFIVNCMNT